MQKNQQIPAMSVEEIRLRLLERLHSDPHVCISVQMPHSRLVQSVEVVITGVYPHVFCVEERVGGAVRRHSFQYADLLTRRVEIDGLM